MESQMKQQQQQQQNHPQNMQQMKPIQLSIITENNSLYFIYRKNRTSNLKFTKITIFSKLCNTKCLLFENNNGCKIVYEFESYNVLSTLIVQKIKLIFTNISIIPMWLLERVQGKKLWQCQAIWTFKANEKFTILLLT